MIYKYIVEYINHNEDIITLLKNAYNNGKITIYQIRQALDKSEITLKEYVKIIN